MKETRFKETEIGLFPEDWKDATIQDLGPISKGKGISRAECGTGNIPCVRYGEIYKDYDNYIKSFQSFISKEVAKTSRKLQYGELLFTGSGETKEDIGKCVAFVGNEEAYAGGDIIIVNPNLEDNNPLFLGFLMNDKYIISQKALRGQGDAVVHITSKTLATVQMVLPPLDEQTRIASALTSIDNLISSLDKLIEKKKNIKQGTMQQLLTGKKRLNGFNEPWVEIELDTIFDLKKGNGLSKEKISIDGIYKCMLYGEIFTRFNYITNRHFHKTNYPEGILSKIGDVLMPASTTTKGIDLVKAVAINEDSVLLGGDIIILRKKKNNQDSYFWATLISEVDKSKVADKAQGITIIHLHTNSLKNIRYTVPSSYKEQSAIASVLTSMDNAIAALEAKKAKYVQIKQGMMQQLLTGKIRLVESASESKARKANIHFKRSVVAAEIADRLCEEPTFGHVKMMKMLFLAERLCHIELDSHYHRDAAGPYDNRALRSIDGQLKRQGWFEAKNVGGRIVYIPLQRRGNHKKYFNKYYAGCASILDKITETFRTMTTEQCEIVATLFSAWEDLLHAGKSCTENDIVNEVLNNWHESKQRISREHWLNAIVWMRREGFVPQVETL